MLRALAVTVLSIATLGAPDAAASEIVTGCLNNVGRITKLAIGDEPTRPCGRRQTEVSLHLEDAASVRSFPRVALMEGSFNVTIAEDSDWRFSADCERVMIEVERSDDTTFETEVHRVTVWLEHKTTNPLLTQWYVGSSDDNTLEEGDVVIDEAGKYHDQAA